MLFLAYTGGGELASVPGEVAGPDGPWHGFFVLRVGLLLVASDQSRSVVYHALKAELPSGTPLLVAACTEVPKFTGMAPGALAWARARTTGTKG